MQRDRHRALVTVYSASPAAQSEPLNGYKYIRELHKAADVVIIAHARDREALSTLGFAADIHYAGSARLADGLRKVTRPLFKESWHMISTFDFADYCLFDLDALRLARRLHGRKPFDVAHRITPTTIRFPSMLWRLGIPTVSGPHNGGMTWPAGFAHLAREEGTVDSVRGVGNALHRAARDFEHYARILVANEHCRAVVPERYQSKVVEIPVNGVDEVVPQAAGAGDATRLLFVGRLVPFKCVDVLLKAMARLPEAVTLTIVGDGPERARLEAQARDSGVAGRVKFAGWVTHDETMRYYGEAGVFVFPSVRESGGAVVLDAMAAGLPVVVAAWAGPQQFIGRDGGIAVSVESPAALEQGIVDAVSRMLSDPALGRDLGLRAQRRIEEEFLWPAKARRLVSVWDDVLEAAR